MIVVEGLDTAWPHIASTGLRHTLQVLHLDADHTLPARVAAELTAARTPGSSHPHRAPGRSDPARAARPLRRARPAVRLGRDPIGIRTRRPPDPARGLPRPRGAPGAYAAATAIAVLHAITRDRLIPKAAADGEFLRSHLAAPLGSGVEIGGCGLALSLRPHTRLPVRPGPRIADHAPTRGLSVATTTDRAGITLTPPLVCDHDQLEAIAELTAASVRACRPDTTIP